jgi:ribonuclease BN (tRNA processing enzyme)
MERLWRFDLLAELDAIVISHMHTDHMLDLVLLAGQAGRHELRARPALYVPRSNGLDVLAALDVAFSGGEERPSRFDLAFEVSDYDVADEFAIGGLKLSFAPTVHRGACSAVRVTDGTVALLYGADGAPSHALERLAANADLLILEATFADDSHAAAASGHMTASEAGQLAHRVGAKRLLLTHLLAGSGDELLGFARRAFGGRVDLAREGLLYELG